MDRLVSLQAELDRLCDAYSGKVTYAVTGLESPGHIARDEDDVMLDPLTPSPLPEGQGRSAETLTSGR